MPMPSSHLHSCMRVSMMRENMHSIATLSDSASYQSYDGDSLKTLVRWVFLAQYYNRHVQCQLYTRG